MAAPLEWVFTLRDKMSGPAKQIAEALGKTEAATKATEKATEALDKAQAATATTTKALETAQSAATSAATKLEAAQGAVAEATEKAAKSGGKWGDAMKTGLAAGGAFVGGLTAISFAVGKVTLSMFEAAAAQDKMNRAFGASLGGGGPAVQNYIKGISGSTEFTRQQLEELALPLARQGLGDSQVARLLPAALDVQAQGGSAAQAIEVFSKIASTGKVEGEAFKALNLNAEKALGKIGERVGMANVADVKKAIEAGQIRSNDILEGLLTSIAGEGMLGDKAVAAAKSPSAALNKFRNIQETVLSQLAESPAMPTLTAALEKFTKAMTSPQVVEGLSKFLEKLAREFERIDWVTVGGAIVSFLEALASIAPTLANLATFGAIGDAKFERIRNEEGGFRGAVSYIPFLRMLLDTDKINGASVAGAPKANDFVMRADGSVLNIDSADALVGFKPGGPIDRMFAQSGGGGGGGVVVESININVDGGGSPEDVAARIAASIRPALIAELDRMAIEAG